MSKNRRANFIPKGRVQVYYNLHKKCLSVRHKGKVIEHAQEVTLTDARFHVQQAGRERVLKQKRKNVHAYIQGREAYNEEEKRWEYIGPDCNYVNDTNTVTITYNPYKNDTFIREDTGEALSEAKVVIFGCGEMGREVKAIL